MTILEKQSHKQEVINSIDIEDRSELDTIIYDQCLKFFGEESIDRFYYSFRSGFYCSLNMTRKKEIF